MSTGFLKLRERNLTKQPFKIKSKFKPSGDQPTAIKELVENFKNNQDHQVLLGVTGSGKTFTMAHVIENLQKPTLILAHNKTLAAQLFAEFKELFPNNAVEYFVSYYDYYQPEAFIPSTNTFIEKDSAINEQIDRMRHSATRSLLERDDVIIISSVSCIYGLGSPDAYANLVLEVETNKDVSRDAFLRELIKIQYRRQDVDFDRGAFRVRGDVVEIFPPYEDSRALRVEFFGNFIDRMAWVDPLRGITLSEVDKALVFPSSHYVSTEQEQKRAIESIRDELRIRINELKDQILHQQAERIEQRTSYDLELISEMGFCSGIENYSRHFTGGSPGDAPPTLLEYFPKDFLTIIDESHVTVPQVGGMYRGDRARKMTLVEHGFRLPSALDNRPLNFEEFQGCTKQILYVSATPGNYELEKCEGLVTEQIIRPTGLLDPKCEVRPVTNQVDDLLEEIRATVKKGERVLVTTLTKRMSEDLTEYYEGLGVKVKYLHSDIVTVERTEILRDLRLGIFDVLIGINLLREGLDLPEVSLVAITDADREGFLRSERSLIQTIGRAARNSEGRVILYGDKITKSMEKALFETNRRRKLQDEHNKKHGITPKTIIKPISKGLLEIYGYDKEGSGDEGLIDSIKEGHGKISDQIVKLKKKMKHLSGKLEFEEAAKIRDEIKRLEILDLQTHN